MPPPKSKVWPYFTRLNQGMSQCKLCLRQIKCSGNTSNMTKHLKLHHSRQHSIIDGEKSKPIMSTATKSSVSTLFTTTASSSLPSTSTIPSTSTSSVTLIDIESNSKHQSDLSSRSSGYGIKECFKTIVYLKEDRNHHSAITNSILYFICKDNRPFEVVTGQGFQKMLKEIAPGYKVPSEKTFKRLLDEKYEALHKLFLKKFEAVSYYSITCDVWTETMTMKSFLGVTLHYIQGTSVESTFLATKELDDHHTALDLSKNLCAVLAEWNIQEEKIVAVVTDNGANVVSAIHITESMGKNKHIPCFAHILNLVAETVTTNASVIPIIFKIREIVKWVKANDIISDQMRNSQKEIGIEEGNIKKFILDVKTQWNSVFYMLKRYLELQEIVNPILLSTPKSPDVILASEVETARNIISLLQPLEFITKECSGEKYIKISKIIPMLYCCTQQLNAVKVEDPIIESCKTALKSEMIKKFEHIELCTHIALATLLDPRFKNLNFQNASACDIAIEKLKKLIDTMDVSTSGSEESDREQSQKLDYSSQFWSHHNNIAHGKKKVKTNTDQDVSNKSEHELTLYLRDPVSPLKSNPLQVWDDMKTVFPNLYKISQKFLCVVATSVPSECLFSKAGATVSRDRNRLLGKRITKLLFLGTCNEEEWGF